MSYDYFKVKRPLLNFFQKYEQMFDGTLGKYTGSNYAMKLEENITPYHAKPFPIPKLQTNS